MTCSVGNCDRTSTARSFCSAHYQRWKVTGDPGPAEIKPRRLPLMGGDVCSVDDCGRPYLARGFCRAHYQRHLAHGDAGSAKIETNLVGALTYSGAHSRVKAAKGSASGYSCHGCGRQASDWAYTNDDPDALADDRGYHYSADPDRYQPMCRPCHTLFDNRFGEHNGQARLTRDQAVAIREARAAGITYRELAARYGVAQGTITDVIAGRTWNDLNSAVGC